jgi:hypothetical protein
MRFLSSLLLAGGAVVGLAVLAPTVARELDRHHLTIPVPGGGVETIEYSGKIAPKVSFEAIPVAGDFADRDAISWAFAPPSFAALDRISAEMDRQMNAMMHQAEMLQRLPEGGALDHAVLNGLPPGASFSLVSQSFSNGACTQMTRITQSAGDAKPQVVSQSSGNCGQDQHEVQPVEPGLKQANYPAPVLRSARTTL